MDDDFDDTTGNLLKMVASDPNPAEQVPNLRFLLPRRLAHIAGEVVGMVHDEQWTAAAAGRFSAADELWGSQQNHTGARSIRLDVQAKEHIVQAIEKLGFSITPMILGEERPRELRTSLPDGQLIFVIDALDGSTRANTLGEGFASVIVAFMHKGNKLRLLGAAIAASVGDVRISIGHLGGWSLQRGSETFHEPEVVNSADHDKTTIAMVTGGSTEKGHYLLDVVEHVSEQLRRPVLFEANGGNPKLFPLLGLKLDVLLQPTATKVYDSALLLALTATPGATVWNLETNARLTFPEVVGAFEAYIDSGGNNDQRDMPPYLAAITGRKVSEAVLGAVAVIGLPS